MFLIYIFGDYYKDFLHFICLLSKLQYFQYSRTLIKIFSIGILFFKILYFFKKIFFLVYSLNIYIIFMKIYKILFYNYNILIKIILHSLDFP